MQTLTIEVSTSERAHALHAALSQFRVELWEREDGPCRVEVELGRGDREIVDVLNAIERYLTERDEGAAHIQLNGREYTLHAAASAREA